MFRDSGGFDCSFAIEKERKISQLIVQLHIRILEKLSSNVTESNVKAYLKRNNSSAALPQTPSAVHAHHACTETTSRIITRSPPFVVFPDVLT